jgi:alpha-tubulin suppressor-like RCC1 family protein
MMVFKMVCKYLVMCNLFFIFVSSQTLKKLALGQLHTCVIQSNLDAYCFGSNDFGQLGLGNIISYALPQKVLSGGTSFEGVCAGIAHTCYVIFGSGGIQCVGRNQYGQLGMGDTLQRNVTSMVTGMGSGASSVFCGEYFTCVILTSGAMFCFGQNSNGQLGTGVVTAFFTTPQVAVGFELIGGEHRAVLGSGGYDHACVTTMAPNAGVMCAGNNALGQLGIGTFDGDHSVYLGLKVLNGTQNVAISCGEYFTCSLLLNGTSFCWGFGGVGQIGINEIVNVNFPVAVQSMGMVVASMGCGYAFCCVSSSGHSIKCWGSNSQGQFGVLSNINRLLPFNSFTRTIILTGTVIEVASASGQGTMCVLFADGLVMCAGQGDRGQLGRGIFANSQVNSFVLGLPATFSPSARPTFRPSLPTETPTLLPTSERPTSTQPTLRPTHAPTSLPTASPNDFFWVQVTSEVFASFISPPSFSFFLVQFPSSGYLNSTAGPVNNETEYTFENLTYFSGISNFFTWAPPETPCRGFFADMYVHVASNLSILHVVICIRDVPKQPVVANLSLGQIPLNTAIVFQLSITDRNNFLVDVNGLFSPYRVYESTTPTLFVPNASMEFFGVSLQQAFFVTRVQNWTECLATPVEDGQLVPPTPVNGFTESVFLFCLHMRNVTIGPQQFSLRYVDYSPQLSNWGFVDFEIVSEYVPVSLNVSMNEGTPFVLIQIEARNTLNPWDPTFSCYLHSFPQFGNLTFLNGSRITELGVIPTSFHYRPLPLYFNSIAGRPNVTFSAPDGFLFQVGQLGQSNHSLSPLTFFDIFVFSVVSSVTIIAPAYLNLSLSSVNAATNITTSVVDLDRDAYRLGVTVRILDGLSGCLQLQPNISLVSQTANFSCGYISLLGFPTEINRDLSNLFFNLTDNYGQLFNGTQQVIVTVYKPATDFQFTASSFPYPVYPIMDAASIRILNLPFPEDSSGSSLFDDILFYLVLGTGVADLLELTVIVVTIILFVKCTGWERRFLKLDFVGSKM